jgi:hypothetical protein
MASFLKATRFNGGQGAAFGFSIATGGAAWAGLASGLISGFGAPPRSNKLNWAEAAGFLRRVTDLGGASGEKGIKWPSQCIMSSIFREANSSNGTYGDTLWNYPFAIDLDYTSIGWESLAVYTP